MNIDWAIPCRYVEVHDNLGTIIGAGIDTFWFADLPAQLQVALAVRLVGLPDEFTLDQQHTARNVVRDPSGEVVTEVGGEFTMEAESARADWLASVIAHVVVQFEVSEEGTYTIELNVDDASSSLPIHVVHGQVPGSEA